MSRPLRERAAAALPGVRLYDDYDRFLRHGMDAVLLANFFDEHAPLAIAALDKGLHVLSETAACKTLGEGVALCGAVERSGCIYMFAENYPFSAANMELRRLYRKGTIGNVRYAEGEYNHPGDETWRLSISPGLDHWRNWIPPTYYCSHALAPLMVATDTMPVQVNALSIVEEPSQSPHTVKVGDTGAVLLVRMNNGAVFRIFGLQIGSMHRVRYEIHGDRGLISTADPNPWTFVRVHREAWHRDEGEPGEMVYAAEWPAHGDLARKAGHGGGDFWVMHRFAEAIRAGRQPYLNVYRGVAMAAVGIQGWRSCLEEGCPQPVPDFRKRRLRKAHEDDAWSPFPGDAGPGQPPPSIRGYVAPSAEAIARARKVWRGCF